MNKSKRIIFDQNNTNDTTIKVLLEQDIEKLEFLSLELSSNNIYQNQNSDYGVLIGRVIANDGVGVPNAKISIFIPISEDDVNNDEIYSVYPYTTPRNKNNEGKRYNLLPRVSSVDPITNKIHPKQPFGSFPLKEEIVTNPLLMNVYKKYYKYTTVTNESGDYMIFGTPIGIQTVHMSVDITDIGYLSMTPASMISDIGYSPNLFTPDKVEIKYSNDLADLPNIETIEIGVNIVPFWGNSDILEVGITRQDFKIRSKIIPTFTVFGTAFTDNEGGIWGKDETLLPNTDRIGELYRANNFNLLAMSHKRNIKVKEKIYYYNSNVTDDDILNDNIDPQNDISLLNENEYTSFYNNGDFIFVVPCNRKKKITNDNGESVEVEANTPGGIFTEFKGFIVLRPDKIDNVVSDIGNVTIETLRFKLKFPQHANKGMSFGPITLINSENTDVWRKQSFTFCQNKYYTLSKYHPIIGNHYSHFDECQMPSNRNFFNCSCIFQVNNSLRDIGTIVSNSTLNNIPYNHSNCIEYDNDGNCCTYNIFGLDWMNIGIHFPQIAKAVEHQSDICNVYTTDYFYGSIFSGDGDYGKLYNSYYVCNNNQNFVANTINTCEFVRSDIHWTDIVEVPHNDILIMNQINSNGFYKIEGTTNTDLTGNYRNGCYIPTSINNSSVDTWCAASPLNCSLSNNRTNTYFYKGHGESDVIQLLVDLKLV